MERKKDDPLKVRFLETKKEIYNHYTEKKQTEHQSVSVQLKRRMSESEWESEVIEIDTDITVPGSRKKTNHTVTDILIKKTYFFKKERFCGVTADSEIRYLVMTQVLERLKDCSRIHNGQLISCPLWWGTSRCLQVYGNHDLLSKFDISKL